MTRLARGDPAMGAAIAATNAPALAARLRDLRAVLDAWLAELERPGGPRRGGRRASGSRPPARSSSATRERRAGLRRAARRGPRRGRLVRPPDRRPRRVRGRARARRPLRAARRDGARPVVQAGHPVPRPARRRPVLPDAADRRPAATRGSTAATRSASAATSTRATAACSAGCAASGRRSSSPTSCRSSGSSALLNDDTTEVGAVHLGAVYVADAAGRPVAIRETDKLTGSFVDGGRRRGGRRPARDVEPARLRVPASPRTGAPTSTPGRAL